MPDLLSKRLKFDLIFIDGSHLLKDVMEDLVFSWNLLKTGGFLIMDDFHSDGAQIKQVFDFYFAKRENEYKIVYDTYQRIVKKMI